MPDEKLPLRDRVGERKYWIDRKMKMKGRSILYRVMPAWLVREAMMYASRYIKNDEIVPEVPFMDVFERVHKAAEKK